MKNKCKHNVNERQVIGFGLHSYSICVYAVVCRKCGKLIYHNNFEGK